VKDPDSSPDVKKPDAEDMSLADLLGGDVSEEPSTARRVEARKDEPDSGMVNLAKMVAGSSVETAKTPSLAPPPPPAGFDGGDPTGSQAVPVRPGAPIAAPPHKGGAAIWVLVIAVIALGAVGIYFVSQPKEEPKGESKDGAVTQALLARFEEQEKKRLEAEERIAALMAKLEAQTKDDAGAVDEAAKAALEKQIAEAKAAQEEAAKKAEEAAKKAEASGGTKVASTGGSKKPAAAPEPKPEKKPAAAPEPKPEKKPASGGGGGSQSELDSLLGGGGSKKAEEEKKPAAAPADSTPAQLGKAEIQQAMAPVASKAQTMCAKYSTGSVQVKVSVAGPTGRVQSAETVGAFANSTAGNCVAALAKTAKFPKFKDATQSFTYPIVLK
jgi:hypothetical protein